MDLLSSYDDEASSTPKSDRPKAESTAKEESLSSEWGNVEKANENASANTSEPEQTAMDLDEEDESHLPPGVRRKNRLYVNSSSSSSEDERDKVKDSKDLSSDSDSDKSDHKRSKHESSSSTRHNSKHESKRSSRDKEVSGKGRHSRSRSGSRSRSRSRSPRRRRKSSDRSRHSRSRSRDRRHKKERRRRSHRSRSRDRRRSRDTHRHKRDHRRSRSRSRDRRDRHRDHRSSRDRSRRSRSRGRHSRSRSRSGDRRRDRSHSRSLSPVGKVIKFGDKVIKPGASFGRPSNFSKPLTFKEKMRQQLIKAMEDGTNDVSQALTNKDGVAMCTQTAGVLQQQPPQPKKPPVPLMANIVTSTASLASMTVTASEAAMQSMLALQKEATEKTGVEIPKYYNPAAINPMKYAEQVQKRKLLWSKSKDKDVKSQWHATSLSGDHDDKSKEKFRKLMGIKEEAAPATQEDPVKGDQEEKHKQLFDQLHKEYQFARMATHTHRGIGLGFGSAGAFQEPPT